MPPSAGGETDALSSRRQMTQSPSGPAPRACRAHRLATLSSSANRFYAATHQCAKRRRALNPARITVTFLLHRVGCVELIRLRLDWA